MLIIYIQSLENRISIDPLTGLNNRGQLHRYIAQENALFREGKKTYVMMINSGVPATVSGHAWSGPIMNCYLDKERMKGGR